MMLPAKRHDRNRCMVRQEKKKFSPETDVFFLYRGFIIAANPPSGAICIFSMELFVTV